MPSFKNLFISLKRVRYGLTTPSEFLLSFVDSFAYNLTGKNPSFSGNKALRRMRRDWRHKDGYHLKDAKLPVLDEYHERICMLHTMYETYCSYLYFDDKYDEKTFDICDSFLSEGLYGLHNDKVDVTVKAGDIVIDAGSWVGDFAAYASAKGATIYAFEPTDEMFKYVTETAKLNKNIIAEKKGISNEDVSEKTFYVLPLRSACNTFLEDRAEDLEKSGDAVNKSVIETIRIDSFVKENNLKRVDFIKADIEGYERYMLEGAQETLKNFAPKLALCTYHLPDDPEVMAALIKKANPAYNIVQKKHKLFASVPK